MSRRPLAAAAFLAWAAFLVWAVAPAAAAPVSCEVMVSDLGAWLDAHPQVAGTARQTVAAQLQHQPTRDSVAQAKSMSREHLVELLGKAKAQQQAGDMRGCETTLKDVERMLRP